MKFAKLVSVQVRSLTLKHQWIAWEMIGSMFSWQRSHSEHQTLALFLDSTRPKTSLTSTKLSLKLSSSHPSRSLSSRTLKSGVQLFCMCLMLLKNGWNVRSNGSIFSQFLTQLILWSSCLLKPNDSNLLTRHGEILLKGHRHNLILWRHVFVTTKLCLPDWSNVILISIKFKRVLKII